MILRLALARTLLLSSSSSSTSPYGTAIMVAAFVAGGADPFACTYLAELSLSPIFVTRTPISVRIEGV